MHLQLAGAGRVGRVGLGEAPLGRQGSVFPWTRRSCETCETWGAEVALFQAPHPPQPTLPEAPAARGDRVLERGPAGLQWVVQARTGAPEQGSLLISGS